MTQGRKPVPNNLRHLHGNPGKRPITTAHEPKVPTLTSQKAPAGISKGGRKIWAKLCPQLDDAGLLRDIDIYQLAALCDAVAAYQAARKVLDKEGTFSKHEDQIGNKYQKTHPAHLVAKQNNELIMRMGANFGLSPVDRTKLADALANLDNSEDPDAAGLFGA